jgi:hypothetical protein
LSVSASSNKVILQAIEGAEETFVMLISSLVTILPALSRQVSFKVLLQSIKLAFGTV